MKIKKNMRSLKRSEHGSVNCGGACFVGDNVFKKTGSLEAARNAFRDRFADREPPTKM